MFKLNKVLNKGNIWYRIKYRIKYMFLCLIGRRPKGRTNYQPPVGITIELVKEYLREALNIDGIADKIVNGDINKDYDYLVKDDDYLIFIRGKDDK